MVAVFNQLGAMGDPALSMPTDEEHTRDEGHERVGEKWWNRVTGEIETKVHYGVYSVYRMYSVYRVFSVYSVYSVV